MRRRKGGPSEADMDGETELRERLLPADQQQEAAQVAVQARPWWRSLLDALTTAFRALAGAIAAFFSSWTRPKKLSLVQAEQLQRLRALLPVAYDAGNAEHLDALQQLWAAAFPGEAFPEAIKSARWKDMGWQGEDPGTDFRSAGFFGLQNLLYFAHTHPALFISLKDKRDGQRADWEYPFACAGLNLTLLLAGLLDLLPSGAGHRPSSPDAMPRSRAAQGFVRLLQAEQQLSEVALFGELYCAAFQVLDARWLEMKASYMQFNQVLQKIKAELSAALASQPASLEAFRGKLGLQARL